MLLLLGGYGAPLVIDPATVDGAVIGDVPRIDYAGSADPDDPNVTLNNNTPITFHNGSNLTFHNGENITFHDPYGNPSTNVKASIPRTEYAGAADL